jgi:hypothetical protein
MPSTTDTLVERNLCSPLLILDESPIRCSRRRIGDPDKLLAIDLRKHHGDADKLYEIAKDLQHLGRGLQTEVNKLHEDASANLTKNKSKGSTRRDTDFSLKKGLADTSIGIAVVFDPSVSGLSIRSRDSMKGLRYITADLQPFNWWSDSLHIYFCKSSNPKLTAPQVKVLKKKLPDSSDDTFIRTIKLGQLGFRVKLRRITGRLNVIYVLSPESQPGRSIEMTTSYEPSAILR